MDSSEIEAKIRKYGESARKASLRALSLSEDDKNKILLAMASSLRDAKAYIQEENEKDLSAGRENGLNEAMLDRLKLNDSRFDDMVQGLEDLTALDDPVGSEIDSWERPNGLKISRIRVPIGVIGIIYESRPNVTADAAGLCIKTSNAVILRGGREAMHSNLAIAHAMKKGGLSAGMPEGMLDLIDFSDRDGVRALVQMDDFLDMVVPRGGEGLIRAVTDMSKVPVLKHFNGICHTYVDSDADLKKAEEISFNAKVQRPGVCNAMETLLVHSSVAGEFLPKISKRLEESGVELRGDAGAQSIVSSMKSAVEEDWETEYLELILSVKVVDSLEDAVAHINKYGSRHTDVIVTESKAAELAFLTGVDSGVLMVNASSRFNDGAQFGLGAEIGISTDKLHARGPVGAEGLTTYKYIVRGEGQIRE